MILNTKSFRAELEWAQKFIEKKTSLPILTMVLFQADGKLLTLTATDTDLEVGGVTSVDGAGKGKWAVAVPVAKLIKYLAKVDDPEVTLATTDRHQLVVTHGASSKTTIDGMSKESFPELPTPPKERAKIGRLDLAIERVLFAISKEESRFTLNGALLEINGDDGKLVGTDGHRLSLAPVQVKGAPKVRAIIPKKALFEAGKLEGDCTFSMDEDHVFMAFGQRRIIARKLKGNFPDYERVLVHDFPNHVMLPVKTTLKTLARVAVYADERSRTVRFTVEDGKLTIYAQSLEAGEAGEAEGTIQTQPGESDGKPLIAGYNADYISDFLSRTDFQYIAFCWQSDTQAEGSDKVYTAASKMIALTTQDGWQVGIMPLRI